MTQERLEVVAAILVQEGKVLATQRGYGEFEGWWEFPGGKVDPGEAPEQALVREIHEELNASISVDRFLCTAEYDYPAFHLSMRCYVCTLADGSFELLEHRSARWLGASQLREVKWLPADIQIVDTILASGII